MVSAGHHSSPILTDIAGNVLFTAIVVSYSKYDSQFDDVCACAIFVHASVCV